MFLYNSHPNSFNLSDVDDKIALNLIGLGHATKSLADGRGSQARILTYLLDSPKSTQKEITRFAHVTPASASEILFKLEKYGYITRSRNPEDARAVDIVLTEEGRKKAVESKKTIEEQYHLFFSCLDDKEKDVLLEMLERLNNTWETEMDIRKARKEES